MTPGVLLSILLVGFVTGTPVRRQDGGGNFGYEYGVTHPSGSSRVHVRAGSNHGNSYRANNQPNGDYSSEASYVNPHYVDPYYQPNRYGSYPSSYDRSPYSVQGNLGYSSPRFEQQTNYDDALLNYPQNKIEQVSFDPKPTFGLVQQEYEPQLSVDQQVLIDEPVISQTLVDTPVLTQIVEDIPPPKIIVQEPESPIVQQASVDVSPHIGDSFVAQVPLDNSHNVLHRVGAPVVQDTIDKYPSQVKFAGPSKYQLVPFGPPYEKISHSTEIIHGPPRSYYSRLPPPVTKSVIPPRLSQQQEYIEEPLTPLSVKLPPPPVTKSVVAPVVLTQQQLHVEEPLSPPVSVKLPPPPVTKSVAPVVLSQQQELVEEPLIPPVSIKIPPPPVTKSAAPVLIPQQQVHIDEPIIQPVSVKLPPPITKSVQPVVLSQQQEHVDVPLALPVSIKSPPPPVTKSVVPVVLQQQQEHIEEPVVQQVNVKIPPPPVTKSVVALPQQHLVEVPLPITKSIEPVVLSQQQEIVEEPIVSVKLPPPPVTKTVVPAVVQQQQEYVEEPLHSPLSVKLPPAPVTKSITPVIVPDAQVHIQEPIYPSVKTFHAPPVTKSAPPPFLPPTYHSVKTPPVFNPPLRKHYRNIKAPPNAPPYSVKQPYARSYHVKRPYVSKPPLTYAPFTKSPIPYSVKQPYVPNTSYHYGNPHIKSRIPVTKSVPISYSVKNPVVSNIHSVKQPKAVKGYPHVKAPPPPPSLSQSSYVDEPLPPSPHSIKTSHKTVPVAATKPKYLPVGHSSAVLTPEVEHTVIDLDVPQETPHLVEESIPLPPVSHAFQITPVVTPVEPLPSIIEDKVSSLEPVVAIPLDTPPAPISHSIRLPVSPLPRTTQVPNLFKAVPSSPDGLVSGVELVSNEKVLDVSPLTVTEPKVSALRSDVLSSPVSQSVRLGAPRYRETYGDPKKDFPAFPAASAYEYPDPVSDRVNKEIGGNFGERINGRTRL